jgi:hypothetical protein
MPGRTRNAAPATGDLNDNLAELTGVFSDAHHGL